jgi:hypothetical protein
MSCGISAAGEPLGEPAGKLHGDRGADCGFVDHDDRQERTDVAGAAILRAAWLSTPLEDLAAIVDIP